MSKQTLDSLLPAEVMTLLRTHRTTTAATFSSIIGVGFGYPFDAIKTRMQTSKFASMNACMREMYGKEGMAAFYRGCLPTIWLVAFLRSVTFFSYHQSREGILKSVFPIRGEERLASEDITVGPAWKRTFGQLLITSFGAGFVAGAVQSTINTPMELVKIGRQLERVLEEEGSAIRAKVKGAAAVGLGAGVSGSGSGGIATVPEPKLPAGGPTTPNGPFKPPGTLPGSTRHLHTSNTNPSILNRLFGPSSSLGTAARITRTSGPLALYTGFRLHMARDTLGTGVYWLSYESFKHIALLNLPAGSAWGGAPLHMLAGGMAGVTVWLITFPIDLVKSVVQKSALMAFLTPKGQSFQRKTALGVIQKRWRVDGLKGFYWGIGATLVR